METVTAAIHKNINYLKSHSCNTSCEEFKHRLLLLYAQIDSNSLDQSISWIACVLAYQAACTGNIAVGALLTKDNKIVCQASNQSFIPYFRSDGHPEMLVISEYESSNHNAVEKMKELSLFSSLEPCPMCLARIATTSLKAVKFTTKHDKTGMTDKLHHFSETWRFFLEDIQIEEANCAIELKQLSLDMLNYSLKNSMPKLLKLKSQNTNFLAIEELLEENLNYNKTKISEVTD